MCRRRSESKIGSYAGRIAPPGMPKTTSTPSSSRARTSDWAPVAGSAVTTGLSVFSGVSVSSGALRQQPLQQKTPRAMHGGVSARQRPGPSDHALRNYYDESLHAHTVANSSKHCQVERRNRRLTHRNSRMTECWPLLPEQVGDLARGGAQAG